MKQTRKHEDGEDKVVQPPEVEFGEGAVVPKPEETITPIDPTLDPKAHLDDVDLQNLSSLRVSTEGCFKRIYSQYVAPNSVMGVLNFVQKDAMQFIPYYLHIEKISNCQGVVKTHISVPQEAVLDFIVESWGQEVYQTGLLENSTIVGDNYDIKEAVKVFPELESVMNLESAYIQIRNNPFFTCYAVPDLRDRAFFAGALDTIGLIVDNRSVIDQFVKGLENKQIFEYAKEQNRLPEVSRLVELYQSL